MKKYRIIYLFIIFYIPLFSAPVEKINSVTLQLKWKHAFQFAGFYMAKEKGFYKEHGLEVSFQEKNPDTNITDDVLSQRAEYGVSDSALVFDRMQGKRIVALRAILQHSPLALLSLKSTGINDINGIKNRRVMISSESYQNVSLMAMLKSHGIQEQDIKIIPMSFDLKDLIEGRTDLFTSYTTDQPHTLENLGLEYTVFTPSTYGFDFYGDILFTSEEEIKTHPERVKNFIQASMDGWYYAFEHPDETAEVILQKYNTQHFTKEKLLYEAFQMEKLSGLEKGLFGKLKQNKLKEIGKAFAILGYHGNIKQLDGLVYHDNTNKTSVDHIFNQSSKFKLTLKEKSYLAEKEVLKICYPPDLQPFSFTEKDHFVGMAADYMILFENNLGIHAEAVRTKTMKESIEKILQGKCDIHMAMIESEQYKNHLSFTKPYFEDTVVIATKADEVFIPDIQLLQNKKIGVLDGSTLYNNLKKIYPYIEFVPFNSIEEGLDTVERGDIFGFTNSMMVLSYYIQHEYLSVLKISGKFDHKFSWSLGIHNSQALLAPMMDRLLDFISPNEAQKIFNHWVSIQYEQGVDYKIIWKVGVAFLVLLAAILLWNRKLILHKRELEAHKAEIDYIAYHDILTGLPNRAYFSLLMDETIKSAESTNSIFAILFIDLDRFKIVNDTLGHHVGDEMIKVIAKRIQNLLRKNDIVARIGGDEFVILLENINSPDNTASIANKILRAINEVILIDNYEIRTTASIGITHYPADGTDIITLIRNADSAMYLAKEEGKNNYQFYTPQLSEEIRYRMEIEHDLKNAIDRHEFTLEYQPLYELKSQKIIAAETLLRWNHHKYGMISPSNFIPIAEESGYILKLSNWVFIEACKNFLEWKKQNIYLKYIAINLSGVQFNHENIVEELTSIIDEIGIDAKEIVLEITEHYVMEDLQKSHPILAQLRKIGFQISIDDFGTGYSSMNYFKRLPFDTIKIDKSFIDEIPQNDHDVAILKAILTLSKSLNYTVVAEGIESIDQESFLIENGCDIGQGYLFAKPMNNEQFLAFFRSHQ